jgi:hypothetical protein
MSAIRKLIYRNAGNRRICDPGGPTKEDTMTDDQVRQDDYPTVNFVLDAIAGWVNKYRALAGA